jgi:hypothetical protein
MLLLVLIQVSGSHPVPQILPDRGVHECGNAARSCEFPERENGPLGQGHAHDLRRSFTYPRNFITHTTQINNQIINQQSRLRSFRHRCS